MNTAAIFARHERVRHLLSSTFGASARRGIGAGRRAVYQVPRALRFRSANSNYANLTPAAGTQDKWKIRISVKRAKLGAQQCILSAASSSDDQIYFDSSDHLCWDFAGTTRLVSTAVYRDPAKWGIWEFIYDAANGTSANRARVFYNGGEVTAWATDTRSSITTGTSKINTNVVHNLGRRANGTTNYFDGYMSDFVLIDNDVVSLFSGTTDLVTGVYIPVAPSSPRIWLKFSDNSSTASLGSDSGALSSAWTMNNFSVTAGITNDSLVDTPTNYGTDTGVGGEVRGNYCTWHVLQPQSYLTLSDGGLKTVGGATNSSATLSTFGLSSGKWVWEHTVGAVANSYPRFSIRGVSTVIGALDATNAEGYYQTIGAGYLSNGEVYKNNSLQGTFATLSANDVVRFELDLDNLTYAIYKNNTLITTVTGLTTAVYYISVSEYNGSTSYVNFGQRPFVNAANSGFKAVSAQNLSVPAIKRGDDYLSTGLRTGTGSAFTVTGLRFQPDIWLGKRRDSTGSWMLANSVRGAGKYASPDSTAVETSDAQSATAFNSDGVSGGTASIINTNAATYVDLLIRKAAAAGIDVVQYTGTTLAQTISHGLNVAPDLIIAKRLTTLSEAWPVYSRYGSGGATAKGGSLKLNTTAAYAADTTIWNNTDPTSSVFSVGTSAESNVLGETFEAILFASIEGFSRHGAYTGSGSADGPFVWCGFRPRLVLIKRTDSTGDWYIWDGARDSYNPVVAELLVNSNAAEAGTADLDILSNGFKIRATTAGYNASSGKFVFLAFASSPFKYARAR